MPRRAGARRRSWRSGPPTRASARRFAWFTIDRGDNDPVRFWAYAIESLRTVALRRPASLAALGVSGTDPVDVVLPPLINELAALDGRVVLVLEDYHLIQSDAVHDGVAFLRRACCRPRLELAIATRLDPPLPLARLRARGEMLELRTAELRFDEDGGPGAATAQPLGDALSGTDVERLRRAHRGLGRRASTSPRSRSAGATDLPGVHRGVRGRRPAHRRLPRRRGARRHRPGDAHLPAADVDPRAALRRRSATTCSRPRTQHAGLLEIERANLFLVAARRAARVVPLPPPLRRPAPHELERAEPELVPELHRRAGDWLASNGALDEAIRHLLAADDERAGGAARRDPVAGAVQPRRARHRRPLARRPAGGRRPRRAGSLLARAWVLMDRGRPREAERWLPARRAPGPGEAAVLRAVLAFKLGGSETPSGMPRRRSRSRPLDSPLGLTVAQLHPRHRRATTRGGLDAAAEALAEGSAARRVSATTRSRGSTRSATSALIRLDQGDPGRRAGRGGGGARAWRPSRAASAHFVTAMAQLAHGRLDADDEALEQAVTLARRGAAPVEVAAALLGARRRTARPGHACRGAGHARGLSTTPDDCPS